MCQQIHPKGGLAHSPLSSQCGWLPIVLCSLERLEPQSGVSVGVGGKGTPGFADKKFKFLFCLLLLPEPRILLFSFSSSPKRPNASHLQHQIFSFAAPCSLAGSDLKIQSILMAPSTFFLTLSTCPPLPLQNQNPRSRSALASTNRDSDGAPPPPQGGDRGASRKAWDH